MHQSDIILYPYHLNFSTLMYFVRFTGLHFLLPVYNTQVDFGAQKNSQKSASYTY